MTDYAMELGKSARRLNFRRQANPYPEGECAHHMWNFGFISEGMLIDLRKAQDALEEAAVRFGVVLDQVDAKRREE